MMRRFVLFALAVSFCCAPSISRGATISVSIDGALPVVVPNYQILTPGPDFGKFAIGPAPGNDFFIVTAGANSVMLSGLIDPAGRFNVGFSATDGGASSTFRIAMVQALTSPIPGPVLINDSISGSVTNALGSNVVLTALAPPVPHDGDGAANNELQVFSLSTNGITWTNAGTDQGPSTTFTGFTLANRTQTYGPYEVQYAPGPAGGPWTHMRADFNFQLSGDGDIFTLAAGKAIVPEPSTLVAGLIALALFGGCQRRHQR